MTGTTTPRPEPPGTRLSSDANKKPHQPSKNEARAMWADWGEPGATALASIR